MEPRPFQKTILLNLLQHMGGGSTAAVIQVPTGGGKSLAMIAQAVLNKSVPFYLGGAACPRPRSLILKPDTAIRDQVRLK